MSPEATVKADEQALWSEIRGIGCGWAREELLKLYDPFAKSIAVRMYAARADNSVAFDDYLQYARVGLIESVARFDVDRGAPFSSFAGVRIRGAILNGIAKESELAAQIRFWRGRLRERMDSLRVTSVPDAENATLDDIADMTVGLAVGAMLDRIPYILDESGEVPDPRPGSNPYSTSELTQLASLVRELVEQLPERERRVVEAHYVKREEFQSVAHELGISKGRVSQLHAQALSRLRKWLSSRPKVDGKF